MGSVRNGEHATCVRLFARYERKQQDRTVFKKVHKAIGVILSEKLFW